MQYSIGTSQRTARPNGFSPFALNSLLPCSRQFVNRLLLLTMVVWTLTLSPSATISACASQAFRPLSENPALLVTQEDEVPANDDAAGEVEEVTFEDIAFDMDEGEEFDREFLTDRIRELDGKEIRIRGFMRPDSKATDIDRFIFVRDNQECCFGPGAALCDCILVKLAKEHTVDFTVRPITISGKFFLKEFRVGKRKQVMAIFRMKDVIVE